MATFRKYIHLHFPSSPIVHFLFLEYENLFFFQTGPVSQGKTTFINFPVALHACMKVVFTVGKSGMNMKICIICTQFQNCILKFPKCCTGYCIQKTV